MDGEKMETGKTEITVPSLAEGGDPVVFSFVEGPEPTVNELSRRCYDLAPDFFANMEELAENPTKAASLVIPVKKDYEINPNSKSLGDAAKNAILAAAKLETARGNLVLTKRQAEAFGGLRENFLGFAAFILGSKKIRNPLIALTTMAGLASGCKSADINLTPPGASLEPTAATQTNEVAQEATSVPTPTRPDFEGGAGGPYTPEQIQRITNGEFSDQENALENWTRYWGAAENGPFRPETKDLHYRYLFDDGGNCFVLLEASGEGREGKLFALPIRDGLFMAVPPETPEGGFEIPEGFGPLMLAGSVAYRDGGLVRLDDDGGVSERLNLETARWETARFLSLLPETLEGVREGNVLRRDHLEEDLATLLEKEKQVNVDAEEMEPFNTGISGRDIQENKLPGIIPLDVSNKNSIVSLSYLENDEGRQIYVLGVALKRPGSENVGIMHFAVDMDTLGHYNSLLKLDQEYFDSTYDLANTYKRLKSGEFSYLMFETVLWRGYAEEGGVWDPLLDLNPGIADRDGRNKWLLNMYLGGQSLDRETGEWVTVAEYGEERLISELEGMVLPAVSIGVIR